MININADILNEPNTCNDILYHYTKIGIGLEEILYNGELKFNCLCNMNDPLEFQDFNHIASGGNGNPDERFEQRFYMLHKGNKINDIIKSGFKVACFSKDNDFQDNSMVRYHKGYAKSRMWSQYGDNHKGFCFILDKNKLLELTLNYLKINKIENTRVYHDSLKYDNSLKEIIKALNITYEKDGYDFDEFNRIEEHLEAYLFTKREDYKDEQEYRFAVYDGLNEPHLIIPIFESIIGIIVGCRFPKVYGSILIEYAKKNKIKLFSINWFNDNPEIVDFEY